VVPLPDGLDPDDVAKQGAAAYQACLDAAMPLIDYKLHALEGKYDLKKSEDKRNFPRGGLEGGPHGGERERKRGPSEKAQGQDGNFLSVVGAGSEQSARGETVGNRGSAAVGSGHG